MLGVVIVDDEALSRVELTTMIDWEKEGFCILGEAENGQKGCDVVLATAPDIVITDIKMPVMDGLEMIKTIRKAYDGARYVVLSSYEEFGLLKTAMDYGVTDYLVKLEFTPGLLKKTLEKQRALLAREKDEARILEISPASKAAQALRRVLAGQNAPEDIKDALALVNPAIDAGCLSCIAVRLSFFSKSRAFREDDRRTLETAAHSIINDITKKYFAGFSFLTDAGVCLFVYSADRAGGDKLAEMSGVIINMLRQYLNIASAVGITPLSGGAGGIAAIMADAIRATDDVFFQGYGKIICSSELPDRSRAEMPTEYDWSEPLSRALELRRSDKVREVFDVLTERMARPETVTRSGAFNLCFSVVCTTLSRLKKCSDSKGFFNDNLYDVIGRIDTLEGLREWLRSFEASILELFDSLQGKTPDDYIVTAAKRFISENYAKPISLNMVADYLSISAGYLSNVFKRKASIGFIEYVTKVKITEAKRLLLSGQYKIYEVAERVGYEDTSYFTKIFHKQTGFTPKDYISHHL